VPLHKNVATCCIASFLCVWGSYTARVRAQLLHPPRWGRAPSSKIRLKCLISSATGLVSAWSDLLMMRFYKNQEGLKVRAYGVAPKKRIYWGGRLWCPMYPWETPPRPWVRLGPLVASPGGGGHTHAQGRGAYASELR
jgi:hypothetical protein